MPKARSVAPVSQKIISTFTTRLLCTAALALVQVGTAVSQDIPNEVNTETVLDGDGGTLNILSGGRIRIPGQNEDDNGIEITGRNNTINSASGGFITHEADKGYAIHINQTVQGTDTDAGEPGTTINNSGAITGGRAAIFIGDENRENVRIVNQAGGNIDVTELPYAILGEAQDSLGDDAGEISVINIEGTIRGISLSANGGMVHNGVDEDGNPVAVNTVNTVDDEETFGTSTATIDGTIHGVQATGDNSEVLNHGGSLGVSVARMMKSRLVCFSVAAALESKTTAGSPGSGGVYSAFATDQSKTITNAGTIDGIERHGIEVQGEKMVITNSGRIKGATNGVVVAGDDLEFTNSGTISGDQIGFQVPNSSKSSNPVAADMKITNQANAIIEGISDAGVDINGNQSEFFNHGTIKGGTAGVRMSGLGQGFTVNNYSEISGNSSGFTFNALSHDLNNFEKGRIVSTTGAGVVQDMTGLTSGPSGNTVNNSGLIEGQDVVILITGAGTRSAFTNPVTGSQIPINFAIEINNSGVLKTKNSFNGNQYFVRDLGDVTNVNLTLDVGTQLLYGSDAGGQAMFDLGGGENVVNIKTGLSTDLLFVVGERTDEAGNELPDATRPTINADSGLVISENLTDSGLSLTICQNDCAPVVSTITVDESAVAVPDTQLADLTRGISSAVSARLSTVRNDGRSQNVEGFSANGADGDWLDHRFWTQAFGSFRQNRGSSTTVGGHQQLGGVMFGADEQVSNGTLGDFRGGLFGGFAIASQETSFDTLKQDAHSYFFGGYASMDQDGLTYDISLTAGYSDVEQERLVVQAGGNVKAESDYDMWFVSPEIRITKKLPVEAHAVYASLGLGYSALFLDGYTESGVASPVTLNSRDVHIGVARGELSMPGTTDLEDGSQLHYRMNAGLEARSILAGKQVEGSVLSATSGNALTLNHALTTENTDAFGAFVGVSGEYDFSDRIAANAGIEGLVETTGDYQVSGTVGLKLRF